MADMSRFSASMAPFMLNDFFEGNAAVTSMSRDPADVAICPSNSAALADAAAVPLRFTRPMAVTIRSRSPGVSPANADMVASISSDGASNCNSGILADMISGWRASAIVALVRSHVSAPVTAKFSFSTEIESGVPDTAASTDIAVRNLANGGANMARSGRNTREPSIMSIR